VTPPRPSPLVVSSLPQLHILRPSAQLQLPVTPPHQQSPAPAPTPTHAYPTPLTQAQVSFIRATLEREDVAPIDLTVWQCPPCLLSLHDPPPGLHVCDAHGACLIEG
jgi:hypothetical protein